MKLRFILPFLFIPLQIFSQIRHYPFEETFDTLAPPALPTGWETSRMRSAAGDFISTRSTPYSESLAVVSSNATIEQFLISPPLDFSSARPESLSFYERRSSSHTAALVLEASTDDGMTYVKLPADTLRNSGSTAYCRRSVDLASIPPGSSSLKLRWHLLGDGAGTSGTIRFDNVRVTARSATDLAVSSLSYAPIMPSAGDTLSVTVTVVNAGLATAAQYAVAFYCDLDRNGSPDSGELFFRSSAAGDLAPADSTQVTARLRGVPGGKIKLFVIAELPGDQYAGNDTASTLVTVRYQRSALRINEIMYDPAPGNAEYVELYNSGPEAVDLNGWSLSDQPDTAVKSSGEIITRNRLMFPSGRYFVMASDSSIFRQFPGLRAERDYVMTKSGVTLNNGGDLLVLRDPARAGIDSLRYDPAWHNPSLDDVAGRSLERINPLLPSVDPRNWTTCADPAGGTPGRRNSVFTSAAHIKTLLAVQPNPFSPDGDGHDDLTAISFTLPFTAAVIRLRIFDAQGRAVRTLSDGEPSGAQGTILWDGLDDSRRRVPIGIYVVLLEAASAGAGETACTKGIVVVATKL
jgi:hypothetical protein